MLGCSHVVRGEHEEGLDLLRRSAWRKGVLGIACILAGKTDEAREILNGMLAAPDAQRPSEIALIHLYLGQRAEAERWLDKAFDERDYMLQLTVRLECWLPRPLDPLIVNHIRRMGLEH